MAISPGHVLGNYEFTKLPLQTFAVQQNPYEKYFRYPRYLAHSTQHVIPPLPRTMHTAFRYPRYLAQLCKQSVANYPAPSAPYPAQCTQHVMPPLPRYPAQCTQYSGTPATSHNYTHSMLLIITLLQLPTCTVSDLSFILQYWLDINL